MNSKYFAKKVKHDGKVFDSEHEYLRYKELKNMEDKGIISDLVIHPKFELQEAFEKNKNKYRAINYEADFCYKIVDSGKIIVEDVKGFETDAFKINQKLFEYAYFHLSLSVLKFYKGSFIDVSEYNKIKRKRKDDIATEYKKLSAQLEDWNEKHPEYPFSFIVCKNQKEKRTEVIKMAKFIEKTNKLIRKLDALNKKDTLTAKQTIFLDEHISLLENST